MAARAEKQRGSVLTGILPNPVYKASDLQSTLSTEANHMCWVLLESGNLSWHHPLVNHSANEQEPAAITYSTGFLRLTFRKLPRVDTVGLYA